MNAIVSPPRRRGACPGLAAPMPTGDGLLARLATGGATIGLDAVAGAVRGGAPPRQWHHRGDGARQHPDPRPDRRLGTGIR